jgi:hypothetical protein
LGDKILHGARVYGGVSLIAANQQSCHLHLLACLVLASHVGFLASLHHKQD